jgi:hypothetical protein
MMAAVPLSQSGIYKISSWLIFVEQSTYYMKGVKQFVVIIDASHFSNYNSYAIRHIKILFQTEQWGVFSENIFWALHKMCQFPTAQGTQCNLQVWKFSCGNTVVLSKITACRFYMVLYIFV